MKPCIFCGNPADSKEDLFPRWILKRVVTRQPLYRQMGDAPPEITEDQVIDAGRIINPLAARNQIQGAVVMGIGVALLAHVLMNLAHVGSARSD